MPKLAKIKVDVLVVIQEKDGVYFARCPFLNMSTHANSRDKAFENLREEIQFLFTSAFEDGSLIDLLDFRTSRNREPSSPGDSVHLEFTSTDVDLPANIPGRLLERFADAPEFTA